MGLFIGGPTGPVKVDIDDTDYGKLEGSFELELTEDVLDIQYSQDGTQPADKVVTGQAVMIRGNFAQPTNELIALLRRGTLVSGDGGSISLGCELFQSARENYVHKVVMTRIIGCNQVSTDPKEKMTLPKVFLTITGPIEYNADGQRVIPVEGYAFYDESIDTFGWAGYESSLGLN